MIGFDTPCLPPEGGCKTEFDVPGQFIRLLPWKGMIYDPQVISSLVVSIVAAGRDNPSIQTQEKNKLQESEKHKARAYLLLLDGTGRLFTEAGIRAVAEKIEDLGIPPEQLELEVCLSSRGGDPHSAFKLGKILRARSSKVRFHIIEYAKSAATLLSLSGNEIVMGPDAELGPLDVQMEHINLEGKGLLSAIESIKPLDDLLVTSEQATFSLGEKLRTSVQLSRRDAIELASNHTCKLLAPVMAKLEPSAISQAMRALDITRVYAEDFLARYHFTDLDQAKQSQIQQVVANLISAFPDHGCVIWRDLARELGLNVINAEMDPHWEKLASLYRDAGRTNAHRIAIDLEEGQIGAEGV